MSEPWILGYCATHNGAVCLLHGDTIVAAVQEERLTGIKRARIKRLEDSLALNYCLNAAGIGVDDLDMIVGAYFSGDPQSGLGVVRQGWRGKYLAIPHHLAHAAGCFALSGFDDATILVIDGQGDIRGIDCALLYKPNRFNVLDFEAIPFPEAWWSRTAD